MTAKISVTIKEIDNGFTVEEFSEKGPADLDRIIFVKTFKEVLDEIRDWHLLLRDSEAEKMKELEQP